MLDSFATNFGSRATVTGTESGMHVLVRIEGVDDDQAFIAEALRAGVGIYSARSYYTLEPPKGAVFMMGYSSVSEDGIREGIRRLAAVSGTGS